LNLKGRKIFTVRSSGFGGEGRENLIDRSNRSSAGESAGHGKGSFVAKRMAQSFLKKKKDPAAIESVSSSGKGKSAGRGGSIRKLFPKTRELWQGWGEHQKKKNPKTPPKNNNEGLHRKMNSKIKSGREALQPFRGDVSGGLKVGKGSEVFRGEANSGEGRKEQLVSKKKRTLLLGRS